MSDFYGSFVTPISVTIAESNGFLTESQFENYRHPVKFLSVVLCQRSFRLWASDSGSALLGTVNPGFVGTIELPYPTNTIRFDWIGLVDPPIQPTEYALFGYVSQAPLGMPTLPPSPQPDAFLQGTLISNAPPPFVARFPYGAGFVAALGMMTDSNNLVSGVEGAEFNAFSLSNSVGPIVTTQQMLAVAPFVVASGASNGRAWDGSVSTIRLASFSACSDDTTTAFGAGSTNQILTLYHPATSTALVRIRSLQVLILAASVATNAELQAIKLSQTTTPTGGTALTESGWEPGLTNDVEAILNPATPGVATGGVLGRHFVRLGVTGAVPTTNPPPQPQWNELLPQEPESFSGGVMRAGNAEGFAARLVSSAASSIAFAVRAFWTLE